LMVTSPPYPMIQMWDSLFVDEDARIGALWRKLEEDGEDEVIAQIYDAMHIYLGTVWQETYRVLVNGGIACINIGDATRTINGKFKLFSNHARILEICEKIGFITLPFVLWKKPTNKPRYKGKGAFLGSGFLPPQMPTSHLTANSSCFSARGTCANSRLKILNDTAALSQSLNATNGLAKSGP